MKSRLFCFGDSFVDWPIPTYHWTSYLSNHYDVYKFGVRGADNVSILFQLGNLPEYKKGDRIIMVFTEPGRLPRRFYGDRKERFMKTPYMSPNFYKNREFLSKIREYVAYGIVGTIAIGVIHYYIRAKKEFGSDFDHYKFFLGTKECASK